MTADYTPLFTQLPDDFDSRLELIECFIKYWYPTILKPSWYSEEAILATENRLGVSLPPLFNWWYRRVGGNFCLPILSLEGLSLLRSHPSDIAGHLHFSHIELDICSVHLDNTPWIDPPVDVRLLDPPLVDSRLSSWFIKLLIREARGTGGTWFAFTDDCGPELHQEIDRCFVRCDLEPHFVNNEQAYEGSNLLANVANHCATIHALTNQSIYTLSNSIRERLRFNNQCLQMIGEVHKPSDYPYFTSWPKEPVNRWEIIQRFLGYWYGPLHVNSGYSKSSTSGIQGQLVMRFPDVLEKWYQLVGKRRDILNYWIPLELLLLNEDKTLTFYNGVGQSSDLRIEKKTKTPTFDDPPVFQNNQQVEDRMTELIVKLIYLEGSPNGREFRSFNPETNQVLMKEVREKCLRCDFPHTFLKEEGYEFYEGPNILVWTKDDLICLKTRVPGVFSEFFSPKAYNKIGAP